MREFQLYSVNKNESLGDTSGKWKIQWRNRAQGSILKEEPWKFHNDIEYDFDDAHAELDRLENQENQSQ